MILALSSLGRDVTNVAGHNLLAGFDSIGYVKRQGINGTVFALIALDSRNYDEPSGSVTREKLVGEILKSQLDDGGWALSGKEADPDITGMALQALAPYYKGGRSEGASGTDSNALNTAVERALDCLSKLQGEDGGYGNKLGGAGGTSESCAQVIVALTSLKINPATDSRFTKNGNSVIDALLGYYVKGGGFRHTMDKDETNGMATEQGYYALTAYQRYLDSQSSLYDMRDVGPKKTYQILESEEGRWKIRADGSVSIRADGAVKDFLSLMVDGIPAARSVDYDVEEGSTIVILKPEFLKRLGGGDHKVTFVYVDGAVTVTLPLAEGGVPIPDTPGSGTPGDGTPGDGTPGSGTPGNGTQPKGPKTLLDLVGTGDKTSIAIYAVALLASAACAAAVIYRKRRKDQEGK